MPTEISGSTGVNKIQSSAIEYGDLPTGSVLQVKQQVFTTFTQIASTSYVDSGLTLSITPKFASSKILAVVSTNLSVNTSGHQRISAKLLRGSTVIETFGNLLGSDSTSNPNTYVTFSYLDSPSTTSASTYKVTMRGHTSSNIRVNNWYESNGDASSTLTLMEIAGWVQ